MSYFNILSITMQQVIKSDADEISEAGDIMLNTLANQMAIVASQIQNELAVREAERRISSTRLNSTTPRDVLTGHLTDYRGEDG